MGIKSKLEAIPPGFKVTIDLKNIKMIDHSVMENLHHFEHDYVASGGSVSIIGHENHTPISEHKLAGRKN
jgi:MFS superfamily sulfate permease-like transporter